MQQQQQQHPGHRTLVVAVAGLALVATACGTEVATSSAPAVVAPTTAPTTEPSSVTVADARVVETAPTLPPTTTAPPTTIASTVPPTTTLPPTTTALPTTTAPAIDDVDDVGEEDEAGPCTLPPMPDDAVIGGELWFDLGGGYGDHRVVSYLSGDTWKLRVEFTDGAASELEIPGAGAHGVRPVGFADVDLTFGGEELLAVVGGGASTVEIGVFAFLEGGCIHRYQSEDGGDFGLLVGGSVGSGEGLYCGDGYLVAWGYELQPDETYTMWGAAYEPVSLPVFGHVPASDDAAEGLSFDEVDGELFDCHDLTL